MTIATHARRLKRLERPHAPRELTLADLVKGIDEKPLAAGVAGSQSAQTVVAAEAKPPPPVAEPAPVRMSMPVPRDRRLPERAKRLPGPTDVITWDDFMRLPMPPDDNQPTETAAVESGRPRGPWENWGFERPPSYAAEGDDAPEGPAGPSA